MDDLISRSEAIDALAEDMPQPYTPDGSHPADEGIFMAQEIYADCIQTLKELPSAQHERKKGHWIHHEGIDDRYEDIVCPVCHKSFTVDAKRTMDIGFIADDFEFCPYCGSKMEEIT